MKASFIRTCTFVLAVLMVLTIASGLIFEGQLARVGMSQDAIAVTLLAIAFFKVRLVIIHFMEIGHAVIPLRIALEAWVILTFAMILTLYFSPAFLNIS